jgi:hypothetical protein
MTRGWERSDAVAVVAVVADIAHVVGGKRIEASAQGMAMMQGQRLMHVAADGTATLHPDVVARGGLVDAHGGGHHCLG